MSLSYAVSSLNGLTYLETIDLAGAIQNKLEGNVKPTVRNLAQAIAEAAHSLEVEAERKKALKAAVQKS